MTTTQTPSQALPRPRALSHFTVETFRLGSWSAWMTGLNIEGARDVAKALEAEAQTVRITATFEVVR